MTAEARQMHWCVITCLVALIAANAASALMCLSIGEFAREAPATQLALSVFNVVCAVSLLHRNKWGFWGFCASSVIGLITGLFGIGNLIGLLLLYSALHIGKVNKSWPQLQDASPTIPGAPTVTDIVSGGFRCALCAVLMYASVLALGHFISTFDPHNRVWFLPIAYLVRGIVLAVAVTLVVVLDPRRCFLFPRWLLNASGLFLGLWMFAYACPSGIRAWCSFGTGVFMSKNPERRVQADMLLVATVAFLALIIVGRVRFIQARRRLSEGASLRHPQIADTNTPSRESLGGTQEA
jgi:hypothetical protein